MHRGSAGTQRHKSTVQITTTAPRDTHTKATNDKKIQLSVRSTMFVEIVRVVDT
jgi:hypothetical protein